MVVPAWETQQGIHDPDLDASGVRCRSERPGSGLKPTIALTTGDVLVYYVEIFVDRGASPII